jgi:hypothetical protein
MKNKFIAYEQAVALIGNTYKVQVTENLTIDVNIVQNQYGFITYGFKTPIGFGGRHYYSLCNQIAEAFSEQHAEIDTAINLYNRTF